MKSKYLPLAAALALGTAAFLTSGASDESERQNPPRDFKELRNLVTRLENKIGDLEKRLKNIESRTNWMVQPYFYSSPGKPPAYQIPNGTVYSAVPRSGSPRIWGRGEVNGWPYYLIPANDGHDPSN